MATGAAAAATASAGAAAAAAEAETRRCRRVCKGIFCTLFGAHEDKVRENSCSSTLKAHALSHSLSSTTQQHRLARALAHSNTYAL